MRRKRKKTPEDRYFDEIQKLKIRCHCGHKQTLFTKKAICRWCGKWIFRDPKEEFRLRVKEKIRRV